MTAKQAALLPEIREYMLELSTMTNIKTIADFKRAMVKGSKWQATHRFSRNPENVTDLGVRVCGLNNSVDFGFIMPDKENRISHNQWPKKKEFNVSDDNTVTMDSGWIIMTYKQTHTE